MSENWTQVEEISDGCVKYERITLITATESYSGNTIGLSALDYIIPNVEGECQILDRHTEELTLIVKPKESE